MSRLPESTAFLGLAELGRGLRRREFTSLELTGFYLDRLRRIGPRLNAVVTLTADLAREQAHRADAEIAAGRWRGPLHGIPYGAKDLLDTAGIRTTWGAAPFRHRVPRENATVVERLQDAGAVLVAKLAMIELAGGGDYNMAGAAFTGPARNPWDPARWTGGSSSGPGAAVAAGLVGFAIGSETWGSIVNPSTWCGIAGLRPTYGRVSRAGAMALSWTMDKLGPMARRVRDLGWVLAALAGPDARDSSALPRRFRTPRYPARLEGLRLGYFPPEALPAGNPVREPYRRALALLRRLGATMLATALPDLPYGAAASLILDAEGASAFEPLIASPELQSLPDPTQIAGLAAGAHIPAVDYLRAFRFRRAAQAAFSTYLAGFDALVHPAESGLPPLADVPFDQQEKHHPIARRPPSHPPKPRRQPRNYQLGGAGNLLGLPAVAVNMGFAMPPASATEATPHPLPVGLEIVAAPLAEARLLQIAAAFEAAAGWYRHHPQVGA